MQHFDDNLTILNLKQLFNFGIWFFDDFPTLAYRQHEVNDTGARVALKGIRRRVMLIRSGWYKNQISIALKLALAVNPGYPKLLYFQRIFEGRDIYFRSVKLILLG